MLQHYQLRRSQDVPPVPPSAQAGDTPIITLERSVSVRQRTTLRLNVHEAVMRGTPCRSRLEMNRSIPRLPDSPRLAPLRVREGYYSGRTTQAVPPTQRAVISNFLKRVAGISNKHRDAAVKSRLQSASEVTLASLVDAEAHRRKNIWERTVRSGSKCKILVPSSCLPL
jgi:hypothetical protein